MRESYQDHNKDIIQTKNTPIFRSKLAATYSVNKLQQEALQAVSQIPTFIYYNVIPLTQAHNINESINDFSDPDWAQWKPTSTLEQCPYIKSILDSFECRVTNVRLLRLEAGAIVQEHTDPQLDLALKKQIRLHIPIFTNESVKFYLNNELVPFQSGELWYLKLNEPHSVHNQSHSERIQLSIDVVVNNWITEQIKAGVIN